MCQHFARKNGRENEAWFVGEWIVGNAKVG